MKISPVIRSARFQDLEAIRAIYRAVAEDPAGIIRAPQEITAEFVEDFMTKSWETGLILVLEVGGQVMGEIHAYRYGVRALDHNLGDLTIVMDPSVQGRGWGKRLFKEFLRQVTQDFPDIHRVELITRQQNLKTRALYSQLGFREEGTMTDRILTEESRFETPILMVWFNPGFRN